MIELYWVRTIGFGAGFSLSCFTSSGLLLPYLSLESIIPLILDSSKTILLPCIAEKLGVSTGTRGAYLTSCWTGSSNEALKLSFSSSVWI